MEQSFSSSLLGIQDNLLHQLNVEWIDVIDTLSIIIYLRNVYIKSAWKWAALPVTVLSCKQFCFTWKCFIVAHFTSSNTIEDVRGVSQWHSWKRSFQETPRSQIETVTCVSIYIMFHCDSLLWDGFVLVGSTQRYRRTYTITTKHPNETFSKQKRSEKSNRAKSCNRLNNHLETMTIQYCKFSPMNQVFLNYSISN